jgi:hypothetical protein
MGKRDLLREREIGRTFARNLTGAKNPQAEQYYRKKAAGPGDEDILDLDAEPVEADIRTEEVQPAVKEAAAGETAAKDEPEIIINRDAAYFKWKEAQEQEKPAQKSQITKEIHREAARPTGSADSREDTVIREIHSESQENRTGKASDAVVLSELGGDTGEQSQDGEFELPNEEDLLKAVMMDEMSLYGEKQSGAGARKPTREMSAPVSEPESYDYEETPHRHGGVGGRLKDFLLGRDLIDEE